MWPFFFISTIAFGASFSPTLAEDSPLINIRGLAPRLIIDMRYASTNNFTKEALYPVAECLLCEPVAKRLARVQKKLEHQNLGLKVWDCYRPLSVQKKLWDLVPDPRYVADPKTGSRHNRGASVDLTLVDSEGVELAMPTSFDEFTDRAHRDYNELPDNVAKNRDLLQKVMEEEGFLGLPTEWWHFDDSNWSQYALRDEPLGTPSLKEDIYAPSAFLNQSTQLLVVLSERWEATTGQLQRYEKKGNGWRKVGTAWTVALGANGLAWGQGLHETFNQGPRKQEGDKTSPAGLFKMGRAYGYALHPPTGSTWPYQSVDQNWLCIDDPQSLSYNKIVKLSKDQKKDWVSAELMRRQDHLYKWVINIEQNYPDTKADCGSCIFFHVWRRPHSPTEGCTAMEEARMEDLLKWLDPHSSPCLVQLPKDVYDDLKTQWKLP